MSTLTRRGLERRRFLKLGAAVSSLAIGGCGATGDEPAPDPGKPAMGYRALGKTGLRVSEVAFGAHGVDNPALMSAALDAGVNTFCTSGNYMDGREEEALGRAIASIGSRRQELVLLTGDWLRPGATRQSILDSIDASLRRLGTDRIEVYTTSDVRRPDDLRVDALFEAFDTAKRAGKVGHLALSGHSGGMQECLEAAMDDGRFQVFFIKYDFASYPDQDRILSKASERGIGTIVFKTHAGNRQHEIEDLEAEGLSLPQASVKWALSNPDVSSVAVTITNFDQIRLFTAASGSRLSRAEAAMLQRYCDEMIHEYCRFCGSCEASCPHHVAIADVMRYAMYFSCYGRQKEAMRLYEALPRRSRAMACQECSGPCDRGCPFSRRVRTELLEAHRSLLFSEA